MLGIMSPSDAKKVLCQCLTLYPLCILVLILMTLTYHLFRFAYDNCDELQSGLQKYYEMVIYSYAWGEEAS